MIGKKDGAKKSHAKIVPFNKEKKVIRATTMDEIIKQLAPNGEKINLFTFAGNMLNSINELEKKNEKNN